MKTFASLLLAIAITFFVSIGSADEPLDEYEKLAQEFERAGYVKQYFRDIGKCPHGVCPNPKTFSELKELREKALENCSTAWSKDNPGKGKNCADAVNATPRLSISGQSEPVPLPAEARPPTMRPKTKSAPERGKTSAAQKADNSAKCATANVQKSQSWLFTYLALMAIGVLLIAVLAYRKKLRKARASIRELEATIQKLDTELKTYKHHGDTYIDGLLAGQVKGTIPPKPESQQDTLHFQPKVVVKKGGGDPKD